MMHLLKGQWRKSTSVGSNLLQIGPKCGYHSNLKKTWLLVKEGSEDDAQEQFQDSGIIATSGQKHLGATLGNGVFTEE